MKRLAWDVSRLLENGAHLADAKILTTRGGIPVHADILRMRISNLHKVLGSAASTVKEDRGISAGLDSDNEDFEQNLIDLTSFNAEAVEWAIRFIYGNSKTEEFPYDQLQAVRELDALLRIRGLPSFLHKHFGFAKERKDPCETFFDTSCLERSDLLIQAGRSNPRVFPASKIVLCVRSRYFEAFFSPKWDRAGFGSEKKRRTRDSAAADPMGVAPSHSWGRRRTLLFDDVDPAVMYVLLYCANHGELPKRALDQQDIKQQSVDMWLAVLHGGYYFGMDYICSEVEWMLARRYLSKANVAKIWRALPVVPESGNRGLLVDECVRYVEDSMGSFIEPCLRLEAESKAGRSIKTKQNAAASPESHPPLVHGVKAHDQYLNREAGYFFSLPKELLRFALVSGRVRVETRPLREAIRLWARAQVEAYSNRSRGDRKFFDIGERVQLTGLRARPQLNGAEGIIRNSDCGNGRYVVQVRLNTGSNRYYGCRGSFSLLRVKPMNLVRAQLSAAEAAEEILKDMEPPATLFNTANRSRLAALSMIREMERR